MREAFCEVTLLDEEDEDDEDDDNDEMVTDCSCCCGDEGDEAMSRLRMPSCFMASSWKL